MASLANQTISSTYDGLIKTSTDQPVGVSGVQLLEDGVGNTLALSVGRANQGVTVTGTLTATAFSGDLTGNVTGNLTGDVTGDVTGNLTGNVTGDVTGDLTGTVLTAAQTNITSVGTLSSLAVSGNLTVDTNTLYVDATNNRVGIGISSGLTYPLTIQGETGVNNSYVHFVNATTGTAFSDGTQMGVPDGQSYFLLNQREASDIRINTGGSEAMRIDSSGRVGIGTSSPDTELHMLGNLKISRLAAPTQYTEIESGGGESRIRAINGAASSYQALVFQSGNNTTTTERMRIDSSGNVGIGTDSPSAPLEINGGNDNVLIKLVSTDNTSAIQFIDDSTTGGITAGCIGDDFRILTSATERMRITSGGNVLIGTTNATSFGSGGSGFVAGASNRFILNQGSSITAASTLQAYYNPNGLVGSIVISGSATSYNTSSDYRLKENVVPMEGALDRVDALKPSRFNFIADPEKTVDGFLAHEVAEVIPEAISGEKDAVDEEGNPVYQGIDQSKLVPLLVGAIQELRAEIELLKNK